MQCSCNRRRTEVHLLICELVSQKYNMQPRLITSPAPEKQDLPLYTTPELSLTVTGAPVISLRKPEGSLPSEGAPFSIFASGSEFLDQSSEKMSTVDLCLYVCLQTLEYVDAEELVLDAIPEGSTTECTDYKC